MNKCVWGPLLGRKGTQTMKYLGWPCRMKRTYFLLVSWPSRSLSCLPTYLILSPFTPPITFLSQSACCCHLSTKALPKVQCIAQPLFLYSLPHLSWDLKPWHFSPLPFLRMSQHITQIFPELNNFTKNLWHCKYRSIFGIMILNFLLPSIRPTNNSQFLPCQMNKEILSTLKPWR